MNYVFLKGLRFHSPVGVLPQERIVGNDIIIDLKIGYPLDRSLDSDDVADTLNYADVYSIVSIEAKKPVKLLERLAGKIADELMDAYHEIETLDIRITKVNPPMGGSTDGAGVEIHLINTKTEA